jgi:transmembrane sensor
MSELPEKDAALEERERQAAAWVLRSDRGLTPAEQDEFFQWLAADPRHGEELARHRRHWQRLDRLVQWRPEHTAQPNPDLLAPPLRRRLRRLRPLSLALAAAAVVAAGVFLFRSAPAPVPPAAPAARTAAATEGPKVLPDGSLIELNHGAVVSVDFTPAERRVRLEQGEAYFTVAKDKARPFIVSAHGVDVRAVGTMFNVRMDTAAVEVLVTDGRVQVNAATVTAAPAREGTARAEPAVREEAPSEAAPLIPLLEANQRAVVSLAPKPEPPQIATLTSREIERVLAWQHRLLNFSATPLSDVVAEFNRHNRVQLVLIDPELAAVRIDASFRSDNLDGFLRLLEMGFGARIEYRGESEILLRKGR